MIAPSRSLFGWEVLPGVLLEALGRAGSALGAKTPDPKEEKFALPPEAIDALRGRPAARFVG